MSYHVIHSKIDNKDQATGTIRLQLHDRDGVLLHDSTQPVDSWIYQYFIVVYQLWQGHASRINQDAGGGLNAFNSIVVGTSGTAVSFANNGLLGLIQHGTTSNRLTALAPTMGYDEATGTATVTRQFRNDNLVTEPVVQEVGLGIGMSNAGPTATVYCIRDLTLSSIAVLIGATLTVSYELSLPYGTTNYRKLFLQHCIARDGDNMRLYNATGVESNGAVTSAVEAFNFQSLQGNADRGIVVGTGNSIPVTFNTFALEAKISNGDNSGELFYGQCGLSTQETTFAPSNVQSFYLTRTFINDTGANIYVAEVGLQSNLTINSVNSVYTFDRRIIDPPVDIPPDGFATFVWKNQYQFD